MSSGSSFEISRSQRLGGKSSREREGAHLVIVTSRSHNVLHLHLVRRSCPRDLRQLGENEGSSVPPYVVLRGVRDGGALNGQFVLVARQLTAGRLPLDSQTAGGPTVQAQAARGVRPGAELEALLLGECLQDLEHADAADGEAVAGAGENVAHQEGVDGRLCVMLH